MNILFVSFLYIDTKSDLLKEKQLSVFLLNSNVSQGTLKRTGDTDEKQNLKFGENDHCFLCCSKHCAVLCGIISIPSAFFSWRENRLLSFISHNTSKAHIPILPSYHLTCVFYELGSQGAEARSLLHSRCGPWTRSIGIILELVRDVETLYSLQTH